MSQFLPASRGIDNPDPRRATTAVSIVFTSAGLIMAAVLSRMPEVKAQVDATATELAFALVCVGIGSIIGMPFAGRLTARYGTASVTGVFATMAALGWGSIAAATTVPQLAAILFVAGLGFGTWDVAMNVQGSIVERVRSIVLMPRWHGLFSVGAVAGALLGAACARLTIPLTWQFPISALVIWLLVIGSVRSFLPNIRSERVVTAHENSYDVSRPEPRMVAPSTAGVSAQPARRGITATEVLLGLIMLGTAVGEGAANDWLAIALVDERQAAPAVGALSLAGFNITMAIGRFSGGPLIARFGRATLMRIAGLVGAGGVLLLCLIPNTSVAFVGAALWGLGFAIIFPSAISAAGEIPGREERAIAAVSTIGYGGFLLGAPLIGTLAHAIPLLDALLVVAGFGIMISLLSPAARERRN